MLKKHGIIPACLLTMMVLLTLFSSACSQPSTGSQDGSRQTALEFVRLETTFLFDGISETLKATGTTSVGNGWQFTIEFDSRHAGYGDRGRRMLAYAETHHTTEITVEGGRVTTAVMDGAWDMISQRMLSDFEIRPAPIHEVNITLLLSNPPQVSVYIKGGLSDGCTTFHDIEMTREGNTVNLEVTVQHPTDKFCPAIYTFFEKYVNLGSDFTTGTTYTINVNDSTTTFEY